MKGAMTEVSKDKRPKLNGMAGSKVVIPAKAEILKRYMILHLEPLLSDI